MENNTEKTLIRWLVALFNFLVLIGSVAIIAMVSIEILSPESPLIGRWFSQIQMAVCLVFIADFFVRLFEAPKGKKMRYVAANFLFLLVSVPYVNIMEYAQVEVSTMAHHILRIVLLLRGGYGMMIVVRYLTKSAISNLFVSYVVTLLAIAYFSSLFFYDVEHPVNEAVNDFGSALYWAVLQVVTVGSDIVPVTDTGRVLKIVLSVLGICMIPIGSAYVTTIYNKKTGSEGGPGGDSAS